MADNMAWKGSLDAQTIRKPFAVDPADAGKTRTGNDSIEVKPRSRLSAGRRIPLNGSHQIRIFIVFSSCVDIGYILSMNMFHRSGFPDCLRG